MGVTITFLLPFILAMMAFGAVSPFIAVVCALAAGACAVVVFLPARRMLRVNRSGVRATGILMIIFLGIATIVFIALAVLNTIVAVYFYGSLLSSAQL